MSYSLFFREPDVGYTGGIWREGQLWIVILHPLVISLELGSPPHRHRAALDFPELAGHFLNDVDTLCLSFGVALVIVQLVNLRVVHGREVPGPAGNILVLQLQVRLYRAAKATNHYVEIVSNLPLLGNGVFLYVHFAAGDADVGELLNQQSRAFNVLRPILSEHQNFLSEIIPSLF